MLLDFVKESVAESDCVLQLAVRCWVRVSVLAIPEPNLIEKMEPRPVKEDVPILTFFSAEENRGAEDALERRSNALVIEVGP